MDLYNYMNDGANPQARAVLAYLQTREGLEESWDKEQKRYIAYPKINRWQNCREQGYIITMRSFLYDRQINIAFFEHRNSDAICAIKWEQSTINSPTIDTAEFGGIYKNKDDVSFLVGYGEVVKMADWIHEQLVSFWIETEIEYKERMKKNENTI